MNHDQWSKMGEENLGEHNIQFAELNGPEAYRVGEEWRSPWRKQHWGHDGFFTLMKCILNDHWADANTPEDGWPAFHVDIVMSKLYYCWVRMFDAGHPEEEEE